VENRLALRGYWSVTAKPFKSTSHAGPTKAREAIFNKEEMTLWGETLTVYTSDICLFKYRVCLARMEAYGDPGESGGPTDQ
jgi:hypothetical protein